VSFPTRKSVIAFSFCNLLLLLSNNLGAWQAPSSDLAQMIELIDSEKFSSVAQAKQLREDNSQNRQTAPIFDFSYAVSLMKFGRWQEAADILHPFAESRPQVYQARLHLVRCYIELDKLDNVVLEANKILDKLPTETEPAEKVAQSMGTLVGYYTFARKDCPNAFKSRIADLQKKTPDHLQAKLQEAIDLVEEKVNSINDEISKAAEKAETEAESKIASSLDDAERLRAEADAKAAELESREKDRADKFEQVKLNLAKLELEFGKVTTRLNFIDTQVNTIRRNMTLLEQTVTTRDAQGNSQTTTEITDRGQYVRLNGLLENTMRERQNVEATGQVLQNNYLQLQSQAKGLANQKQLDELFTKSKLNQLNSAAQSKQKRAEREADKKNKRPASASGIAVKMKSYATYDSLDIASSKEYLLKIAKRFLPNS
jgi:chromosome segregation ATPase